MKQLPIGWDDEDNVQFETEFFEFLQERGGLDLYIDARSKWLGNDSFSIPLHPYHYVDIAFPFSGAFESYWIDLDKLWSLKLTNLNQTK